MFNFNKLATILFINKFQASGLKTSGGAFVDIEKLEIKKSIEKFYNEGYTFFLKLCMQ